MENQNVPEIAEKPPVGKKKLYIALAAVALVIVAVLAVIAMIPEKTTLGEAFAVAEGNHTAHMTMYRGLAFEQQVSTHEAGTIWETIRDSELQIVDAKKNLEIKISIFESDYIQYWTYGASSLYLYASQSGLVFVEYYPNEGGVHYFSYRNGEAVYEALRSFMPVGDTLSVDEVLPDLEWTEAGIYLYINRAPDRVVYITKPDEIAALVEGLRNMEFPYGGAEEEIIEPMDFTLELRTDDWLETEEAHYFHFNQDGNGEVWMGNWSYSVSGGEDLMIYLTDFLKSR